MPGVGWCVVHSCFIRLLLVLWVTGITWIMYRSQNTPWALTKVRIPQRNSLELCKFCLTDIYICDSNLNIFLVWYVLSLDLLVSDGDHFQRIPSL